MARDRNQAGDVAIAAGGLEHEKRQRQLARDLEAHLPVEARVEVDQEVARAVVDGDQLDLEGAEVAGREAELLDLGGDVGAHRRVLEAEADAEAARALEDLARGADVE